MPNLGGKISLDISEFQAKITEANKLIRSNESAWRASAAQMDDWSKSEDGIKQRLDASNKQVELQRDIIATLVEKRKALIEEYGEESKEVDKVNAEIIKYSKALEKSVSENKQIASMLDKVQAERGDEKTAVERATKVTKENTSAVDKNASEYGNLTSAVKKSGDGFTIFRGVVAGLVADALTAAVKSISSFVHAVNTLPESTRELRKELTQLETAFADVGLSSEAAKETYIDYTAVLGSVDSNANTTISLLASMISNEEQLATWTTVLTGVYAKLGVAIPTNELTKNIQQTANTAKMTENLTKVLSSAGVDTEAFAQQISALNTSEERSALILTTLNNAYGSLGAQYVANNRQLIAAEKAQLKLNTAMTTFGNMLEPIKTEFTSVWADIVGAFGALLSGDTSVVDELAYSIGYLAGSVVRIWKSVYGLIEPYLVQLKDKLVGWFDKNKDAVKDKIKNWLTNIFGEDTINAVDTIVSKITAPLKKIIEDIKNGDWKALGVDALPVITLGVGASLLKSTITNLPPLMGSALKDAFAGSGVTFLAGTAGAVGAVALAMQLKDAMDSGDYSTWADKVLTSILDGLAVYGVTGNITAGAISFALSAALDLSVTEYAGNLQEELGISDIVIGIAPVVGAAAFAGIKAAITSGLSAALGAAWAAAGVSSAVMGTVSIGLQVKDAMKVGDWDAVIANITAGLIAGVATGVITGNPTAGMMAFNIAIQFHLGENALSGLETGLEVARNNINNFITSVETGTGLKDIEVEVDSVIVSPKAVELAADKKALTNASVEILKIINRPAVINSYKAQLEALIRDAKQGGADVAREFVAGYGFEISQLSKLSEAEAKQILVAVKEALGIHSPSVEAKYIGEMFTEGFTAGLEGLSRAAEEEVETAVDAVVTEVAQVKGFWGRAWDNFKLKVVDSWNTFKGGFVDAWEYVKKSFTSWEGFFDMLKDGAKAVKAAFVSVGEIVAGVLSLYDAEEGAVSIYNGVIDKLSSVLMNMGSWFSVIGIILQLVLDAIESGDANEYIRQIVTALIEGVNMIFENTPLIIDMVLTAMREITEGIIDNLPKWVEQIPDIIDYLIDAILEEIPSFVNLGFELFAAIVAGVWRAIKSIGNKIVNGIKSLFGINSPSKVMREEVGRNLGRGVVEGIKDTIPEINDTMRAVNTTLASENITTAPGTGGKIVYVTQNNNYSRSYSAYELYKSERAIKQLVGAY